MKKWIALLLAVICMLALGGCSRLLRSQYNENGVSHFLTIAIDESQPKEYIGELDAHYVYTERLNVDETYFISVTADKIMIKNAIDKGLVSIQDWRCYARETEKDEDAEI